MNNLKNLIRVSDKAIEDLSDFYELGFEITYCKTEGELILRLPENWFIQNIESTKKEILRSFFDGKGRVRGAYIYGYCYLRTRYEIQQQKVLTKNLVENEKLYIFDRQQNIIIADFGKYEPYSDYHKDLLEIAKSFLDKNYPDWRKPSKYWE